MRRWRTYGPWYLLMLLPPLLLSCVDRKEQRINWEVSLDRNSRDPYGTSIAWETVGQYFPAARKEPLTKWFRYTSIDEKMSGSFDSATLLVLIGMDYYVSDKEWLNVLKFVREGNEVFLLSSSLDNRVMRSLRCEKVFPGLEDYPLTRYNSGAEAEHALKLLPDSNRSYGFRGRSIKSFFSLLPASGVLAGAGVDQEDDYDSRMALKSIDTAADTLGTANGQPDFIRYRVGRGHITLHAAPLVLSNYFLLQPGNRAYLDGIWHSFPANISGIYWNEYHRRSTEGSSLGVLFKFPPMRWALLLAAFALLLYVLFGLKRMQRIVPEIPRVENTSVSFVETVGRLYFNKGDHANLAEKMIQHFLEWVRAYYYLDTSQINDGFARLLASKSGKSQEEVDALLQRIHNIRLGSIGVTPEILYELHRSIQSYYDQQ